MGSKSRLQRLFFNLIDNAIKFQGESPPEVHVEFRRDGGDWLFSVRDNGIGIAPENHRRIFEFGGSLQHPGLGFGLTICQAIVENCDGRIWVESKPGKGSTFYFTLSADRGATGPDSP